MTLVLDQRMSHRRWQGDVGGPASMLRVGSTGCTLGHVGPYLG
jgi:hypothetical protein